MSGRWNVRIRRKIRETEKKKKKKQVQKKKSYKNQRPRRVGQNRQQMVSETKKRKKCKEKRRRTKESVKVMQQEKTTTESKERQDREGKEDGARRHRYVIAGVGSSIAGDISLPALNKGMLGYGRKGALLGQRAGRATRGTGE